MRAAGGALRQTDARELYVRGMEQLVTVVQKLSMARSLEDVMEIVRTAARRLTGADGATFVLRDGDQCYYADEDAIAPLWKGNRFPMSRCISGWVMLNRTPATIDDIYADDRIPHDAYRPTFVRSLAMVPIRTLDPVGAIGNYWASRHETTEAELRLLHALADTTAVALENVRVYNELEERVRNRTAALDEANQTIREFVSIASHDLRGPLGMIALAAEYVAKTDDEDRRRDLASRIIDVAIHATHLVEDLGTLSLADSGQLPVRPERVLVHEVAALVAEEVAGRHDHQVDVPAGLEVLADRDHVLRMVSNLARNAVRHGRPPVTVRASTDGARVRIRVSDCGDGVAQDFVPRLFTRFARGRRAGEGTGLGLSIVDSLAGANGGSVRYTPNEPAGACFEIDLPATEPS
jgi:signal transduction histidine kinase